MCKYIKKNYIVQALKVPLTSLNLNLHEFLLVLHLKSFEDVEKVVKWFEEGYADYEMVAVPYKSPYSNQQLCRQGKGTTLYILFDTIIPQLVKDLSNEIYQQFETIVLKENILNDIIANPQIELYPIKSKTQLQYYAYEIENFPQEYQIFGNRNFFPSGKITIDEVMKDYGACELLLGSLFEFPMQPPVSSNNRDLLHSIQSICIKNNLLETDSDAHINEV